MRELAQAPNFATLSVILRSGRPMTHVMWVDADEDHVLINTEAHRAKFRAVERDPRVTVTIWQRDDPYTYAEVRGQVVATVRGPGGSRPHRLALAEVPRQGLRRLGDHVRARDPPDRAGDGPLPLSHEARADASSGAATCRIVTPTAVAP